MLFGNKLVQIEITACRCRAPRATTVSLQDGVLIFVFTPKKKDSVLMCIIYVSKWAVVVTSNLPKLMMEA